MSATQEQVVFLARQFVHGAQIKSIHPFGGGHINDTYLFELDESDGNEYVLQRINRNVFPHPEQVMENMLSVTKHIRNRLKREGGDVERGTLNLRKTEEGRYYTLDDNNDVWRCYVLVARSKTFDTCEDANVFCQTGLAFGRFLSMLDDFDASTLHETIARFHDTPNRFVDFRKTVEENRSGRADSVREEIEFALAHEAFASTLMDGLRKGELPLRVTHNDTKLNNVLFDEDTHDALCVIDLDTVMPGLCAYDFGDSIRFGASTAAEDEKDLDKVHFSLDLYTAFAQGYLGEVKEKLSEAELASLPIGAMMMTLEVGIRFLGDYLNGDVYFKTAYPEHNLVRAHTQFKLLREMEENADEMHAIIDRLAKK